MGDAQTHSMLLVVLAATSLLFTAITALISLWTRAAVTEMENRILRLLLDEYVTQHMCRDHHAALAEQLRLQFPQKGAHEHAAG